VTAAEAWPYLARPRGFAMTSTRRLGFLVDIGLGSILAALPWLYFWRLFAPNRADQMTMGDGDFMGNSFPLLLTVARALRDGALPLWNPLSGGGQPLFAHPQAAVLYPLNWLVLPGLRGLDAGSLLALERSFPIHLALAGVGTYALARVLIGSRTGSMIAALTFAYSGFLTSYPLQQLPVLRSAAWFPLELLAWWLTLQRRSLAWAAITGVLFAIALLAGHPQMVFIEGLGAAIMAAGWGLMRLGTDDRAEIFKTWLLALPAALVAVGLSAIQWLPTRELQALSSRTEEGYNFVAGGFSFWEVPLDLIAPGILGGLPPYMGVAALVLAAAGLAIEARSLHWVLVGLSVGGLLLALGSHTFLYPALYVVFPPFELFRNQERAFFLTTLGVALMAGYGAATLLGPLDLHARARLLGLQRMLRLLLAIAVVVGAALYVGHISAEVANQGFKRWRDVIHSYFFFVFIFAAVWALLGARLTVPSLRAALPALLVGLVALDVFSVTADRQFITRPVDTAFHKPLVVDRVWNDIEYGRMADRDILSGNHGLIYELASVTSTFPLRLARVDTARQRLPEGRFFDLLNVSHLVAQPNDPLLREPGTQERVADAGYVLFKRSNAPGPAVVVGEAQPVSSAEEALRAVGTPDFNLRGQLIVEAAGTDPLPGGGTGTVSDFKRGWNEVTMRASAPTGGYLLLNDVAYPGWRASVDGGDRPILRANYLTQAVWLAPGDHQVRFTYEPDSVRIGALISALTLAALVALSLWSLGIATMSRGRPRI
jgi:hypothetical protein